jgi:hypothetical protein
MKAISSSTAMQQRVNLTSLQERLVHGCSRFASKKELQVSKKLIVFDTEAIAAFHSVRPLGHPVQLVIIADPVTLAQ